MAVHELMPTPGHVCWGIFDAARVPVLSVKPGDTLIVETVSGGPEVMPSPNSGLMVSPYLKAIHAEVPRQGVHILTGPVAVEGAEPGDVLEIRIKAIELTSDWGYCGFRPLMGTLPTEFPFSRIMHIPIDRTDGTCRVPGGADLPLTPFFGVMGVAPPPAYGAINTKEPREHGGNLDNKNLTAGSSLFLPVWVPGANFSIGDGHGVQGDGEVCVMALETNLRGTLTFVLHKHQAGGSPLPRFPRAETATHFISMGLNENLEMAMKQALREMIALIQSRSDLTSDEAYVLCSLAADFHITQVVNGEKGVHGLLQKSLLAAGTAR